MNYKVVRKQCLSANGVKLVKTVRWMGSHINFIARPLVVAFTKSVNKAAYREALDCIAENAEYALLSDRQKAELADDMLYTLASTGNEPGKYMEWRFHDKTESERSAYYAYLDLVYYVDLCLSSSSYELFQSKETLFNMLRPFSGRDGFALTDPSQLDTCAEFLSHRDEAIVKPIANYGGVGVEKIRIIKENTRELARELLNRGACLIEDVLVQSEKMAWLNSSSVNTVRLCSFRGENGFDIFYSALRVGREGSVVDNRSSGGLFIGIDESTHKTCPISYLNSEVVQNAIHPDSGKDLSDFEIPDWNGLIATAEKAASVFPNDIHIFGWDLAHTQNGWKVIELNAYPCDCQCFQGGRRERLTELFAPYIDKEKLYWFLPAKERKKK